MIRFKKFLTESKDAKIPTGTNAIKTSNHLKKHYKGQRYKSSFDSNPYSDHQHFDHSISKQHSDRLKNHLHQQGWQYKESPSYDFSDKQQKNQTGTYHEFKHDDGGNITIHHHHASGKYRVKTSGKKKAKPSTLPYYD